jgi:hypothetical protein
MINTNASRIQSMLIRDKITTFLLKKKKKKDCIDVISDISVRVQFPRKLYVGFWVGSERVFPHLSRRALNILLPPATSYLCETGSQQWQPSEQNIIL